MSEQLPETTITALASAADRIRSLHRGAVGNIVAIGRELLSVKEMLPHGQFHPWLEAEFGMSPRSAQNYMAAVGLYDKNETVALLEPSVIYALAAPSTPEPVRQEILTKIESGEKLPPFAVKSIIAEAKRKQAEESRPADIRAKDAANKRRKEERHRREAEKVRAEYEARDQKRKEALLLVSSIIRRSVVDELPALHDALRDAGYAELAKAVAGPVNSYAAARNGEFA